jgi:hypothetical protein
MGVAEYLLPEGDRSRPTLWHWDIHAPNIFVQEGRISHLIDWQHAWIGPLFLQARHPRLVEPNGELITEVPQGYDDLEDEDEKLRIRNQVEKTLVLWHYETETETTNPLLHGIMKMEHGRTRLETLAFSANTWDGDILPFRQCLIRIARCVGLNPTRYLPLIDTSQQLERDQSQCHLSNCIHGRGHTSASTGWRGLERHCRFLGLGPMVRASRWLDVE